jgi:hypothetical protein
MVNNAVPQPPDTKYEVVLFGVEQDTCRAAADSALFDACRFLGEAILEEDYFDDVLLYGKPVRTDHSFLADTRLTAGQVSGLCEETGAGAVISFDRLLFDMKKNVTALSGGGVAGSIQVKIHGVIRTYLPQREQALATVVVTDSIRWEEAAFDTTMLNSILPSPENALRIAGRYIGLSAYYNFVPHWKSDSRWYYTGMGSKWKEASACASAEKWDLAAEKWQSIYESSANKTAKAKAASNIALCTEIKGDFQDACEWALRSRGLFEESTGAESEETQRLVLYAKVLQKRIQLDRKLNIQFGE